MLEQTMQAIDTSLLPGILPEFAELIGVASSMKLVERYGGVGLYIPYTISRDHPLAELIGMEKAERLVEQCGGAEYEIPKAEAALREIRNREIRDLYPDLSQRQLALKYNLTERQVRSIVCDVADDSQMELFS